MLVVNVESSQFPIAGPPPTPAQSVLPRNPPAAGEDPNPFLASLPPPCHHPPLPPPPCLLPPTHGGGPHQTEVLAPALVINTVLLIKTYLTLLSPWLLLSLLLLLALLCLGLYFLLHYAIMTNRPDASR